MKQDRVGQLFLLDHGSGHVSYRLVVGSQAVAPGRRPVWLLAVISHHSDGASSVFERRDTDEKLAFWDECSRFGTGNITRVL